MRIALDADPGVTEMAESREAELPRASAEHRPAKDPVRKGLTAYINFR